MSSRRRPELHRLVACGDIEGVEALLARSAQAGAQDIDALDRDGLSPLAHAVRSSRSGGAMVRLLLSHGARADAWNHGSPLRDQPLIAMALGQGDPEVVRELIEAGADPHYRYPGLPGYGALLDAVHGRDIRRDPRLIELLNILVSHGVPLNDVSAYQESGLRVLSHVGRFDAVRVLLAAGADESQLGWTPLIRATAIDSLSDVENLALLGADLEAAEWWSRTAWLVAVSVGDVAKARRLRELGADTTAVWRCGQTALMLGVAGHRAEMVRWLLEIGQDVEQVDDFGRTPLRAAVEHEDLDSVVLLLAAGADVDRPQNDQTVLQDARSRDVAMALLAAGADPRHLSMEVRRSLMGLPPESDPEPLADVSREDFLRARTTRFGVGNPEPMHEPFWAAMFRAGVSAYEATEWFDGPHARDVGTPT